MAARLLARLLAHLGDDLRWQVRGTWRSGRDRLRRTWAARPPLRRVAAQALAVALVVLGLVSLDASGRLTDRLPTPRDWRALAALLERDARPGDLVAILPPWLDRARQAIPARLPVLATIALDGEWLPGIRRVWLVAAAQVVAPGARPPLAWRAAASVTQQVGPLRVTRLDLATPVLPVASLTDGIEAAPRWREVQGVARRCVELAPAPGAAPRPTPARLTLGGAIAGHAALVPSAGTGTLRLQVDDGPPVVLEVTARNGWQPFRIDTTRQAGTSHSVTMEAQASGGTTLCVEALILP
jgi:hypothetical protein